MAASLWLLMRAFASGCTAMTGVEAVSNGVAAFREPTVVVRPPDPDGDHRAPGLMLAGIAYLCHAYDDRRDRAGTARATRASCRSLSAAVVGKGVFYYVTIGSVLAVLALSANTGFADFPRLCRVDRAGRLPAQRLRPPGRRLVYSQGILVLAVLSAGLLIAFGGITDHLIPLFAVGAFLAFTLSQAGMVVHWRRAGGPHSGEVDGDQRRRGGLHGGDAGRRAGLQVPRRGLDHGPARPGAARPVLRRARPLPVGGREVATDAPLDASGLEPPLALLPIRGWSGITRKALRFALKISPEVYALHVADDERAMVALEDGWERNVREPARAAGLTPPRLIVIYSPYRRLYAPLKQVVSDLQRAHPGRDIAVIVPELVGTRWYHYVLHNQTAAVIKAYLLLSGFRRVVVVNVPWYLSE